MTDFHDKPYHSKSDHAGDPNKPQEGSHKTSFAFVSDIYIEGIDAGGEKTREHLSRERKEIETSATRHFKGNRLNWVMTEPDF